MIRTKLRKEVALSTTTTTTDSVTLNGYVWFTLEVPDADKAKTVTIQVKSAITGAWEDLVDLSNVTTKYKALTNDEAAIIGPFDEIRLELSAAPAANSKAVFHLSS